MTRTRRSRLSSLRTNSAVQPVIEGLEERRLFSSIVWTNEGNDGFDAAYGADAPLARQIVHAAIAKWETAIVDFNYDEEYISDWNDAGYWHREDNTFYLTFEADDTSRDEAIAFAEIDMLDDFGKPFSADITMDEDGEDAGWYFDPNPLDHGEFNNMVHLYRANNGPEGFDFYTTVLHEIGHAVGIASDFEPDLAIEQYLDPQTLEYNGPDGVQAFFEASQHLDQFEHDDLMDGAAAVSGQRQLISDLDMRILQGAYGYTVSLPSTRGDDFTFNVHTASNTMYISGDPSRGNTITLDVPYWSPEATVNGRTQTIYNANIVLSGAGGSTTFNLERNSGLFPAAVTVQKLGAVEQRERRPAGIRDLDVFTFGTVTLAAMSNLTLRIYDTAETGGRSYSLSQTSFSHRGSTPTLTFNQPRTLELRAAAGSNGYLVRSLGLSQAATIYGGVSNDTVAVEGVNKTLDDILGVLTLHLGGGANSVSLRDGAQNAGQAYTIANSRLTRARIGTIVYNSSATSLYAGSGADIFNLDMLSRGGLSFISGGAGTDALRPITPTTNWTNTWNITGAGSGTLNTTFSFKLMENLRGTGATDRFILNSAGSTAGQIDGGGGVNTLDYSMRGLGVSVNVGAGSASGLRSGLAGGFAFINRFIGSTAGSDTITGTAGANTWAMTGNNAGTLNAWATYSSFEHLRGGAVADTFNISPGTLLSGTLDGAGGTDVLNYSLLSGTTSVTVNLGTATATGLGGTFTGIESLTGSQASDTLIGASAFNNTWAITDHNAGQVNGLLFGSFENLTGGTLADRFVFARSKRINGTLNGGAGADTLDYSQQISPVSINLATGSAIIIDGPIVPVMSVLGIENATGGSGGDTLTGSAGDNILRGGTGGGADFIYGGPGNDVLNGYDNGDMLYGEDGRDILIGGEGSDALDGGGGEDVLIGNWSRDDNDAIMNALRSEWISASSYADRINHLMNGGGVNGPFRINAATISEDSTTDRLLGGADNDWFYAPAAVAADRVVDWNARNELITR